MRYVGSIYRPPSEHDALILQATIGCSWNRCTYCAMFREKPVYTVRPLAECLEDLAWAAARMGPSVEKVFVADGDALSMPLSHWMPILDACRRSFPRLKRVSAYAMAGNLIEKSPEELVALREAGLRMLYIGPESGDEMTMRRIAKGPRPAGVSREDPYLFQAHVEAAHKAKVAGIDLSAIFLLGAGGVARSVEHAVGSARLATAMDPPFLSALTLTVVEGTPLSRTAPHLDFRLPDVGGLLRELRTFVDLARPTRSLFRTNHASNYLPLGGTLPEDGPQIVRTIDRALAGGVRLRPEWSRGL